MGKPDSLLGCIKGRGVTASRPGVKADALSTRPYPDAMPATSHPEPQPAT